MIHFIVHGRKDTVGVAAVDLEAGQEANGWNMESDETIRQTVSEAIPLGHKIALRDVDEGGVVTKYNVPVGKTIRRIQAGEHVHTHNLKTARW